MWGDDDTLRPPSVLDRLLDDAPDLSVDPPMHRAARLRALAGQVRRDLEMLLNTRCCPRTPPKDLPELRRSLLTYGISDFISANLVTQDQRRAFAVKLEEAIRIFEPRFRAIAVIVLDPRDQAERTLRLRVEAMMLVDEDPIPVRFATQLNPATLRFSVAEVSGG